MKRDGYWTSGEFDRGSENGLWKNGGVGTEMSVDR